MPQLEAKQSTQLVSYLDSKYVHDTNHNYFYNQLGLKKNVPKLWGRTVDNKNVRTSILLFCGESGHCAFSLEVGFKNAAVGQFQCLRLSAEVPGIIGDHLKAKAVQRNVVMARFVQRLFLIPTLPVAMLAAIAEPASIGLGVRVTLWGKEHSR